MHSLPPIGAEIPCSILAIGAILEYDGKTIPLDFRGGIKYRVDVNPDDPMYSVRLRIMGHKATAEGPDGMTFTIEQNDIDVDAKSLLRCTQQFPPKYEQVDVLSFTLVIDKPKSEPAILTTKDPMRQVATLTQFPPKGDQYAIQSPVELIDLENPDEVVARLTSFTAKQGGL
ncbi:hypothetical protein ACFXG6_32740 [Streptomyces roseus]|uniref:hypothetical protein n=1 Tax=Streptomyces TaxID=1883 RepID=UPI00368D11C0